MRPWPLKRRVPKKSAVRVVRAVSVRQVLLPAQRFAALAPMPPRPMAATSLPKPRVVTPNPPLSAFVKTHPHLQLRTAKENKHVATRSSQVP
ncbi:hypothetical protein FQZ97_1160820 [compost metagenome]